MLSACRGTVLLALVLSAGDAWADGRTVDSSYGRIDGDIGLGFGAGIVVAPRGPRAEGEVRVRYLDTAGLFATYEDASALGSASEPERALMMGLELRPLFLFRWLRGAEFRQARIDLMLDSIGFELGAFLQQPTGAAFARQSGMGAGLAVELPLVAQANGPWIGIRGGLRWSEAALASGVVDSADDRQATFTISLTWHQILTSHLVEVGDRAPR